MAIGVLLAVPDVADRLLEYAVLPGRESSAWRMVMALARGEGGAYLLDEEGATVQNSDSPAGSVMKRFVRSEVRQRLSYEAQLLREFIRYDNESAAKCMETLSDLEAALRKLRKKGPKPL